MKDLLRNVLEQHGTLTIQDMIMHIVVAAILGGILYKKSRIIFKNINYF